MRILLDECVPTRWRNQIIGHVVETVEYRGWKGLKNGKLLNEAQQHFDVLLTTDQNIPSQQHLGNYNIGMIILCLEKPEITYLQPLLEKLPEALKRIESGETQLVILE